MKKKFVAGVLTGLLLSGMSGLASADLLFDRGLPTDNLNNVAGANRSNVAWAFTGYTAGDYWMVGDTFTNTSAQTWTIDTIRLWTVRATDTTALWGGVDGTTIGLVSGSGVKSIATYADASTYQGSSGTYGSMYQVDFAVNITLAAGQTYDFFLDGTGGVDGIPSAHASNAALSGSPQAGADGLMLYANVVGGSVVPANVGTWSSGDPGGGWDKASDVNVQVMGVTAVPEPETYAMLLAGLGLLGAAVRRRKQKESAGA